MDLVSQPQPRPTWQTSLVVQIAVLVLQFSVLVVLLVVLLHEILWPHSSCWWIQVFLGVVDPLAGEDSRKWTCRGG